MEEVNALHAEFENPRTRRTYRSGSKGYDVRSTMMIASRFAAIQELAIMLTLILAIRN